MKSIRVLKPCSIEIDGTKHSAKGGEVFTVDDTKAVKIISAGFAELFNAAAEARAMVADFGRRDPGGDCWEWIKQHLPAVWKEHLLSMRESDLDTAKRTFSEMLTAWEGRHNQQQPDLLAA